MAAWQQEQRSCEYTQPVDTHGSVSPSLTWCSSKQLPAPSPTCWNPCCQEERRCFSAVRVSARFQTRAGEYFSQSDSMQAQAPVRLCTAGSPALSCFKSRKLHGQERENAKWVQDAENERGHAFSASGLPCACTQATPLIAPFPLRFPGATARAAAELARPVKHVGATYVLKKKVLSAPVP